MLEESSINSLGVTNVFLRKKILIGITGSIAAYKMIELVRMLTKAGAEVRVVMTSAAKDFVSPLVLSTLSRNEVLVDIFDNHAWANHVMLGRWADVMLLAPLSCNTLAKMRMGLCDNLLMAVYLSATCKVFVAPAMDEDMWHHPATQSNVQVLLERGVHVIPVGHGALASGLFGAGRMAEPSQIYVALMVHFRGNKFSGKKILITAGPTQEAIDPVRYISNHSSGKMGMALAEAFYLQGAEVTVVHGPMSVSTDFEDIEMKGVITAEEMYNVVHQHFHKTDIAIMAAAVADYRAANIAKQKIKKEGDVLELILQKNPDILASLGKIKQPGQLLVGFALETNNEKANAWKKMEQKNADLIVLNSMQDVGAGFGIDTNKVTIIDKTKKEFASDVAAKSVIATFIADKIYEYLGK